MPGFDLSSCEALLREVDQQIRQVEKRLASHAVKVRPSEMIAGSSPSQHSCGDITDESVPLGLDFSRAARAAAEINAMTDDEGEGRCVAVGSTNPMQSADLGSSGFAVRYGVGFLCSRYPAGSEHHDLGEVEGYAQPNSAYLRAFAGLDKAKHYTNLKKAAILGRLREWVGRAAKAAPAGQQAELVVSFQGHGVKGGFLASDEGLITPAEMVSLASDAEKRRVSVTFVLDACFSGAAVPEFQDHAADVVEGRLGPADAPDGARDLLARVRALIQFNRSLSVLAGQMGDHYQRRRMARVMAERKKILDMLGAMHAQVQDNVRPSQGASSLVREIDLAFQRVRRDLALEPDPGELGFSYGFYTHEIGIFQDRLSDLTNQLLQQLQSQAP